MAIDSAPHLLGLKSELLLILLLFGVRLHSVPLSTLPGTLSLCCGSLTWHLLIFRRDGVNLLALSIARGLLGFLMGSHCLRYRLYFESLNIFGADIAATLMVRPHEVFKLRREELIDNLIVWDSAAITPQSEPLEFSPSALKLRYKLVTGVTRARSPLILRLLAQIGNRHGQLTCRRNKLLLSFGQF